MKPCFKYKADYTVKSHVKCFSHKSAAPISMLFGGKNVLTSVTQAWLSFFCFITKKNVCCHGDRESRELIQYFITDWTKRKMKHNLPFWKAGRQGLKVFTLLCHLPVTAGTVIMCCKNHYNLSQFSCNCLLSTCQQFSEMMSRLCAGAINCNIHSCHLYPIKMLEGTVSRV